MVSLLHRATINQRNHHHIRGVDRWLYAGSPTLYARITHVRHEMWHVNKRRAADNKLQIQNRRVTRRSVQAKNRNRRREKFSQRHKNSSDGYQYQLLQNKPKRNYFLTTVYFKVVKLRS